MLTGTGQCALEPFGSHEVNKGTSLLIARIPVLTVNKAVTDRPRAGCQRSSDCFEQFRFSRAVLSCNQPMFTLSDNEVEVFKEKGRPACQGNVIKDEGDTRLHVAVCHGDGGGS